MFTMITFPWPVPSANIALTGLAGKSNRIRLADQQVNYLEPVSVGSDIHRPDDARNR